MYRHRVPPRKRRAAAPAAAALVLFLAASGAAALEAQPGEQKAIDACDKRLCTMLQKKDPSGEDLKCALTKTFTRSTLKEGDTTQVKWGFGDARCSVQINISRAAIVTAVTAKSYKFWVPLTTANCVVEQDGQLKTVTAKLEPKIVFKDGRAEKVWINLREVEGPAAIKATLTLGAQLNDSVGLFHRAMLKSINGYIYKLCPKYHPLATAATSVPAKPSPPKNKAATPAAAKAAPAQATPPPAKAGTSAPAAAPKKEGG
jgi:hypothetical protein